ncbi:hypothetical protein [Krasilnikovia sp. MM14-A1259]|uniref:hypothetical protein n=1 Tax=Krasilnikovia sp. MM14-A1259 TaxID=3373539 RepID=UPI003826E81C
MADPLRPTLMTKMRASLGGERDAALLEAMRAAGRVAYGELMAAEKVRSEMAATGSSLWAAPASAGSQNLAAWNAFVLQTLGETLLDADYAAKPGTVGFVPPVTYDQTSRWFAAVESWVSRARQARANPDYDISRELTLPAGLPAWAEVEPCPPEHLAALLAAIPPVREHVDVTVFALEKAGVPENRRAAVNQLKQLAAEAAAATDYAIGLRTQRHHPSLHELIENNLKHALELWFHAGQLAAMPQLLDNYRALRPPVRPDIATLPGGARFDPWCLTDPATLGQWQRDPRAVQAITEMWEWDPDPAATLTLKAEIDTALAAGDVAPVRARKNGTCYYECPWSALYEVRRPVTIGGRALKVVQQFTMEAAADDMPQGMPFRRGIILGPFRNTDEVEYCDPDGKH